MNKPVRKFKNLSLSVEAVEMLKQLAVRYGTTDSGYIERRIREDAKAEGITPQGKKEDEP